jgi:hypothetical protein
VDWISRLRSSLGHVSGTRGIGGAHKGEEGAITAVKVRNPLGVPSQSCWVLGRARICVCCINVGIQ